jgi:hypothetical protein
MHLEADLDAWRGFSRCTYPTMVCFLFAALFFFLARSHRSGVGKISLFTSDFSPFLILIFETRAGGF